MLYNEDGNYRAKYAIKKSKGHVFRDENNKFILLKSMTTLAAVVNDLCIDNYAEIMDEYEGTYHSSELVSLVETDISIDESDDHYRYICGNIYEKLEEGKYKSYNVIRENSYDYERRVKKGKTHPRTYHLSESKLISMEDGNLISNYAERNYKENKFCFKKKKSSSFWNDYDYTQIEYNIEEIKSLGFTGLKVLMENKKEAQIEKFA
jgi:hypothetical protein